MALESEASACEASSNEGQDRRGSAGSDSSTLSALPSVFPIDAKLRWRLRFGLQAGESKSEHGGHVLPMARYYRPELDALRLLAFLMVWSSHALIPFMALLRFRNSGGASALPILESVAGAGSFGVPVFFFLSAFLITELMLRERRVTGTLRLGAFWMRRVLRIWPLYFGILAAYGFLGLWFHGFRIEPGRLLASILLVGNLYIAAHPAITTPLRALWSLSVEEQWYLVWPVAMRVAAGRRFLLVVCAFIFFAAQIALLILAHGRGSALQITAWVNSFVQFQYFAEGAATALLLGGSVPQLANVWRVACVAGALIGMGVASSVCRIRFAGVSHSAMSLLAGYLLAGAGTVGLFFAFYGLAPRSVSRVLVKLGQISYGLYVFHETGFFLAESFWKHAVSARLIVAAPLASLALQKIVALLLTVVLAWMSYRWWETPFLRWKQRWTVVRSRAVSA